MNYTRTCFTMTLLATVVGCAGGGPQATEDAEAQRPSVETLAINVATESDLAADSSESADASPETAGGTDETPSTLNAAHILIMHKDSQRVPPGITRTKDEALALAKEVAINAQADNADFAALAREHSDGPSGPDGGNLGDFVPERMVAPFTNATLKLAIGEVSHPVETQFGYHIIRRQEPLPKASAKHILVMHKGSMRVPPNITRTKEEAEARIQECLARVKKGEKFEDLAREYSDGPSAPRGGDLGEFPQGMMAPAFEQATFACEVGKVTDVVETPFGYHVIYRYK